MKNFIIFITLIIVCPGCASVNPFSIADRDTEYASFIVAEKLSSMETINSFNFSGADPLTDKYLTITANRNDKYLVELTEQCTDLHNAVGVRLERLAEYALTTKDAIVVKMFRCRIQSIYPLTKAQHLRILAIKRKERSKG